MVETTDRNWGLISGNFSCSHVLRRAIEDGLHPFYGRTGPSAPGAVPEKADEI
jgi:hypothetical protein